MEVLNLSTVVTVMNMKGGVGKTTVAMHLGGVIAHYKIREKQRKVLLIDYDPQFNMSQAMISPKKYFQLEDARKTIISVLVGDETVLDPYHLQVPGNEEPPKVSEIAHPVARSSDGTILDIVPSTLDLMYLALGQPEQRTTPIEERFRKFIDKCRENYDMIIIDCHPAGSLFTKTALTNSDDVLIPVIPQSSYAVRGIGLMLQFIKAKKSGKNGPNPHILFNLTSRTSIAQEESNIRANKDFASLCMTNTMKKYKALSTPMGGHGFVWFKGAGPWSHVAFRNVYAIAEEFIDRVESEVKS